MTSTPWTPDQPTTALSEAHAAAPVLDSELSRRLDLIIARLDEERRPLRRRWLQLQKLYLERNVPACGKGQVRS